MINRLLRILLSPMFIIGVILIIPVGLVEWVVYGENIRSDQMFDWLCDRLPLS